MSVIISVSNQKGGVGKTTTSVNVGAALSNEGCKVLLIDLDPQGNATSGLGVNLNSETKTTYDVLTDQCVITDAIQGTELGFLDILPAGQNLSGAELELVGEIGREVRLKEACESIEDLYDFVILDTPPNLGVLTVNALTAAHKVLIPLQSEYYALEGLSRLIKTIELIRKRLNPNLELEGILITMYDRRNNLSRLVADDIKKHFGEKVFKEMIPRNVKLSEAPSHGKAGVTYDPKSRGARAYQGVAEVIKSRYDFNAKPNQPVDRSSAKPQVPFGHEHGVSF